MRHCSGGCWWIISRSAGEQKGISGLELKCFCPAWGDVSCVSYCVSGLQKYRWFSQPNRSEFVLRRGEFKLPGSEQEVTS